MTEPWVKTYSGGKPNYTEPCERCGEVNPAEIHTCTPKQREWVGLTDEEVNELVRKAGKGSAIMRDGSTSQRIARSIEAKLKEKNA